MPFVLRSGQKIIVVNWNGVMRMLVFSSEYCGDYLGEIEKVPQDQMMVPNGTARCFVKVEAAKYGLEVVDDFNDPFYQGYVFNLC
jgi:hypothetical protein